MKPSLCASLAQKFESVPNQRYIVDLVGETRRQKDVHVGASLRGSLALMTVAQALALLDGDSFVTPEHVREMAVQVTRPPPVLDPQSPVLRH